MHNLHYVRSGYLRFYSVFCNHEQGMYLVCGRIHVQYHDKCRYLYSLLQQEVERGPRDRLMQIQLECF